MCLKRFLSVKALVVGAFSRDVYIGVKIGEHLSVTKLSRESLCEIVPAVTGGLLVITS